jgi:hypothetical protein
VLPVRGRGSVLYPIWLRSIARPCQAPWRGRRLCAGASALGDLIGVTRIARMLDTATRPAEPACELIVALEASPSAEVEDLLVLIVVVDEIARCDNVRGRCGRSKRGH